MLTNGTGGHVVRGSRNLQGQQIIRVSASFIFVTRLKTWKLCRDAYSLGTHTSNTFYLLQKILGRRPDIRVFEHCIDPNS